VKADCQVSAISHSLRKGFGWYGRHFIARHFHGLRLLKSAPPPPDQGQPMVFFCNHPSWWDPMVALHLAQTLYPQQAAYGPMAAETLRKYPFLGRLGFFPVQRESARGARRFLEQAAIILGRPNHALWLTPQGRFTDVRQRPVRFAAGLGHLAVQHKEVMFVPVAIEYAWWHERGAEILVAFGSSVDFSKARGSAEHGHGCEAALESLQDRLATASMQRDAAAFELLIAGGAGVGGVYDLWRRVCAWLRGSHFDPRHMTDPNPLKP
jgi:1-acyl-sn-glycerol-3-phosphate acyltransferase